MMECVNAKIKVIFQIQKSNAVFHNLLFSKVLI